MPTPVVLIHGYSDKGESFERWRAALTAAGREVTQIHTCNYETLTNEVSLKDIAEGFDRALRIRAGLDQAEEFDAIVHSTGMLVIRAWLTSYATASAVRRRRLKHLIGLAPATFGSPLAHKGRSWLGSLFKGRKELGPDFLDAGDYVLDGLELASRFTWDLAHRDLIGDKPFYGSNADTPYVFTFCGTKAYGGLRSFINEPGMDGTVRWAGCSLNTRKVTVDLTIQPGEGNTTKRFQVAPWTNISIPFIPVPEANHSTILREPSNDLIDLVDSALRVSSTEEFNQWYTRDKVKRFLREQEEIEQWQQFVVRAVDERGDPITDYNLQLFTRDDRGRAREISHFSFDVHAYKADPSLRCFHVPLHKLNPGKLPNLWLRLIASSGSRLVSYHGYGSQKIDAEGIKINPDGKWDAEVNISDTLTNKDFKFFFPFTTTLIELRLNREPQPLTGKNNVAWFSE